MIRPSKYMDLDTCVLRVAALLLSELNSAKAISITELSEIVKVRLGDDAKYNFLPALNFLYLVDRVTYDIEDQLIVYTLNN